MRVPRSTPMLVCLACLSVLFGLAKPAEAQDSPRRVVFFVVDGAGIGLWSLADFQTNDLVVRQFPVVGLVDTRAVRGVYPGSASAATAFATGERSFIGAIGVGPDSQPRQTVLEAAQASGLATGLVSTARITDATPAAFSSHVVRRENEPEIARQQSAKNITVLMGGGRRYYMPRYQPDSVDLLAAVRQSYTFVENAVDLQALDMDTVTSLFGLFTLSDMPVYPERTPALSGMTSAALAVLDKDPDGFFLLLETESTDTEPHQNVELDVLAGEMTDVEDAIRVVLDYQRDHPETLLIVAGDHDTGGLTVQPGAANRLLARTAARIDTAGIRLGEVAVLLDSQDLALLDSTRALMDRMEGRLRRRISDMSGTSILVARYTTGSHTANLVPLFAKGPGAEAFSGIVDNDRVGKLLLEFVSR